jgi:hypothetical protein
MQKKSFSEEVFKGSYTAALTKSNSMALFFEIGLAHIGEHLHGFLTSMVVRSLC